MRLVFEGDLTTVAPTLTDQKALIDDVLRQIMALLQIDESRLAEAKVAQPGKKSEKKEKKKKGRKRRMAKT